MQLLVSVRSVEEARQVARSGGIDFIDLKEPRAGALGGLPTDRVSAIVRALCDEEGWRGGISATIGDDVPWHDAAALRERVEALAACGVQLVKVGIAMQPGRSDQACDALAQLAAAAPRDPSAWRLVPVLLADHGIDEALLQAACAEPPGFAAVMLDTVDKRGGSLLERVPHAALAHAVALARQAGRRFGLAGSLRLEQLPVLRDLAPDFAGFRGAVCRGDRAERLDPALLARLVAA